MTWQQISYYPHPPLFLLLLVLVLGLVLTVARFVLVGYAYQRLGLKRGTAIAILLASLAGSAVNIPVTRMPAHPVVEHSVVQFMGVPYVIPHLVAQGSTVLAINVGGAVIPVLLVGYLLGRHGLELRTLVAVTVVTLVTFLLARPVPGVGIMLPPFIPALVAGAAAVLLREATAPRTAFIAGTMGTLIGADLLNLGRIAALGAPVASIGGAGTFDGIFLSGALAVLLAGLPERWRRRSRRRRARPPAPAPTPSEA